MIMIPRWLPNALFLMTIVVTAFQLGRLVYAKRPSHLQYLVGLFCLIMIPIVTFTAARNSWLSLAYLVVALACLVTMVRQIRYMPPRGLR